MNTIKTAYSSLSMTRTAIIISLAFLVISCNSLTKVESTIEAVRGEFTEFDKIVSKSDTIPLIQFDKVKSSLKEIEKEKMTSDQHSILNVLQDSLVIFKVKDRYNRTILELDTWEEALNSFLSENPVSMPNADSIYADLSASSEYFTEFLNVNRDQLTQEEINKINDLIGRQMGSEFKEILDESLNKVGDFFQRAQSAIKTIEEELNNDNNEE